MVDNYWKGKKILITGGTGFIGTHLSKELLLQEVELIVLDVSPKFALTSNILTNSKKLKLKIFNLLDLDWQDFLEKEHFDCIFHLAGNANVNSSVSDPISDFNSNILLSIRILESLRKISYRGKFIFPSSAAVYGNPKKLPIYEDDPTVPISPYGVSKLTIERYISIYSKLYGIQAASIRLFSIYGPGQRKLVIYDLLKKTSQNGSFLNLYGDGSQTRDFIFIQDVINGLLTIAKNGKLNGEVYNLATGVEYSIQDIVEKLSNLLNINPKIIFSGSVRLGEPERWAVNINNLKRLGFKPKTSLEEGLIQTITWFKEENDQF